jgi:hypothetical protein
MKQDSRMDRNYLRGKCGDKKNSILATYGFNPKSSCGLFFGLFSDA